MESARATSSIYCVWKKKKKDVAGEIKTEIKNKIDLAGSQSMLPSWSLCGPALIYGMVVNFQEQLRWRFVVWGEPSQVNNTNGTYKSQCG